MFWQKSEQPLTKLTHIRELEIYCIMRETQLAGIIPILQLPGVNRTKPEIQARNWVKYLQGIREQLSNKEPEAVKLSNLQHFIHQPAFQPFARDIKSILLTGKAVLPELGEISSFLAKEAREAEAERIRLSYERKARHEREEQESIAKQKKERLNQLAQEIGADPQKLAELVKS